MLHFGVGLYKLIRVATKIRKNYTIILDPDGWAYLYYFPKVSLRNIQILMKFPHSFTIFILKQLCNIIGPQKN